MPLTPGTRLGAYEVSSPLGAGGMGEVYRARDTRLGREVAIKALPAAFAQDPERVARFEREAKLLASLSHPNIGAIYGLEEVEGHRYLVLEFVEGETLDQRLSRGPLPLADVLDVGRQVAAAVEAAHESGVVHRDLKPGNIMLTPSGVVKVLDFGLAKAADPGTTSDPHLSASPTMTYAATGAGMILGTAAYMSPEQARGKAVDKRTDIWSFGTVLYECLTGRRCFEGETVSDMIARILQGEPDWTLVPAQTPNRVRELMRRCLEKDARRRLRDIGDARIELEEVIAQRTSGMTAAAATAAARSRGLRPSLAFGAIVAAATAAVTLLAWSAFHRVPAPAPLRFEVAEADGMRFTGDPAHDAISPDGELLAFVAGDSSRTALWIRPMGSVAARAIPGTEGALMPFWSPDGRDLGFFTDTKLKRVPAAGGDVVELCDVKRARGGAWNRHGDILFAPTSDGPLFRVAAAGGDAQQVTTLDSTRQETGHRAPCFLPDGRHFLFSALPPKDGKFDICVGDLGSSRHTKLLQATSGVAYTAAGYLVFHRNGTLAVQRFDAAALKLVGAPVTLRENAAVSGLAGAAGLSLSDAGSLVYGTAVFPTARLAWYDLAARELERLPMPPVPVFGLDLSPDGRRVVLTRSSQVGESEVWTCDLERGVLTRLSEEPGTSEGGSWSPDGSRVAYFNSIAGPQHLVVRSVTGAPTVETYLENDPTFKQFYGWTPDGRFLLYARQSPATRWDLWLLPMEGDHTPRPYLVTPYTEVNASVSRDGRWLCYTSDESGQNEVYVQAFPGGGSKYQVTSHGGQGAFWLRSGRQLAVIEGAAATEARVADILPGSEFRLGPLRPYGRFVDNVLGATLSMDDQRQLCLVPAGRPPLQTLTIVMNWIGALKQR